MNCISCKEPLIVLELDQIELDYCVTCGGIWLDAGELEALLEEQSVVAKIMADIEAGIFDRRSHLKCPICRKKMIEAGIGSDPEIYIDFCRSNHGIWFDKGELQGVIKFFEKEDSRVVKILQDVFRK